MCKELLNQINLSEKSIDIAVYGYGEIPIIFGALKNAQNRGVKIRLVTDITTDNSNIYEKTYVLKNLIHNSHSDFGLKTQQAMLMHNKFYIFDEKKVLTGSFNLAPNDMSGFNTNIGILINSKKIANIYGQEFNQMYEMHKFHTNKEIITDKTDIGIGNSIISVYFSPKDTTIENLIIPLVESAKEYILIPAFLITHKNLTASLIEAKKRGVDVKIIMDAANASSKKSTCNTLRENNIKVKAENYAGKMHAKAIIVDDKYAVVGSMNFTMSGETKNDENIVLIENPQVAIALKDFFNKLWDNIPDKWLTETPRAESLQSIGSCYDGIDNDFDGKTDLEDSGCKALLKDKKGISK